MVQHELPTPLMANRSLMDFNVPDKGPKKSYPGHDRFKANNNSMYTINASTNRWANMKQSSGSRLP